MNPEYISAGITHTIPEKLFEYFVTPFTDWYVVLMLIIMFANMYMLKKLRKIRARDYITLINIITLGIYFVFSIISAVLVCRLGPHGNLKLDLCDSKYMLFPILLFYLVGVINIIECIVNVVTKIKKDKKYNETMQRGYYAEENERYSDDEEESNSASQKNIIDSISSFAENVKEKINVDGIKDKVNQVTEDVKDLINNKNNKD